MEFSWPRAAGFGLSVPEFSIAAGEKVLLLGASGSGKSTLLGLICGILRPTSGNVRLLDTDIASMPSAAVDRYRANTIGVIFQMFNLLPFMTALDNVVLPLSLAADRRSALTDPTQAALDLTRALGLNDDLVRTHRAADLSIGQQQRVAAARALIGSPPLIVADEPTSALDGTNQAGFLSVLTQQIDNTGATLMMVSHDQSLASYFDRTIDIADICKPLAVAS